jgi:hypothetical protein
MLIWADRVERGHTLAQSHSGGEDLIVLGLNVDGVAKDECRRSVSSFPACISLLGEGSAGIVSEEAVHLLPEQPIRTKALPL